MNQTYGVHVHRDPLLNLLTGYSAKYPLESGCTDKIIEFVNCHDNCFDRELSVGHITGSAWIVNSTGTHTLLTHHKKLNKWLQLGGHADGDSNVMRVAKREANEESGLAQLRVEDEGIFDLDIHPIPTRGSEAQHFHYDVRFVLRCSGSEKFTVSDESHDLAWVEIARLADYSEEASMLRMAQKWIQRQT
jgi:8-oxo-dGTP pyrophosphatase MutT (NUDIX family)